MTVYHQTAIARTFQAAFAAVLVLHPLTVFAAAITPTLAEVPIQGINPVKPNVMFTLDDSGSMTWDYSPDWVVWNEASPKPLYCRDGRQCGLSSGSTAINVGSTPYNASYTPYTQIDPPLRSSDFNQIYYDPAEIYYPGVKSDGTPLPCEGSNTACSGPWTAVYMNGFAGYPGANTNNTINLAPTATTGCSTGATPALCVPTTTPSNNGPWKGVPDTLWCRKSSPTAAEYMTADGNGSVCRRNGRPYASVTSGGVTTPAITAGYNYPNSVGCTDTSTIKCKFTTPVTAYGFPYYYKIASVWFCSGATGQWGTSGCGTRQDFNSTKYVRYAASASGGTGFEPTAFTRVDITPSGFRVNGAPATAVNPSGSGRTVEQEYANFAKFYAFNRTRVLLMKTAGGIAFSNYVGTNLLRAGYHSLWENSSATAGFLNVKDFNSANAAIWFSKFYAASPDQGTPLPDAMWRIGEYFSNKSSGLPGATDPLDPTTGKCQPNYHLLSTDGYWNNQVDTAIGNWDRKVPTLPTPVAGLTPGADFPRPYFEGPTTRSDNLADLAMYYWARDIRTDKTNEVKDSVAPWQHVVLYGLAVGAQGNLVYPTDIDNITSGAKDWPLTSTAAPYGPESIDDLWHAAVNSRGKYFNTQTPRQLAESIISALADFTDQNGTGTGVGIGGAQLSVTNQHAYKASYEKGLWGDVKKYVIDINTGVLPVDADGNPLNAPLWSAATQLDAQAAVVGPVIGWDTRRRIVTMNSTTATPVPFRLANLSAAQQSSLNIGWNSLASPPTPQAVLNYLRGDKSNEGVGTTNFRARPHTLGDIVYSSAVPVGAPKELYLDTGTTGSPNPGYNAFKSSKATRAPAVYVGANDGMLHAFDDTVANGGKETWAYIPMALFSGGDPNDSAHTPSPAFQLGALAFRRGGIPLHAHKFYVNATPRVADIDFANTNTSSPPATGNDWRTILVGGLGAGGRSVYALDVTNPIAAPPPVVSADTEATAATKVLWEYTEANLGYVYDSPTLAKTRAYGWVALVASGYSNPGGKGFLYVLNPNSPLKTGQLLKKIPLPGDTGTDTSPTGLGTIRAFTASRQDPYVLQAYGGDLKGNVWRFDLSNVDPTQWKAELIAKLKDPSNKAQPITSGVRVEIDQNNNVDRYLYVGTGQLLDQPDLLDTSVRNTMYVIKDGNRTTPEPAPAVPYSRTNLNAVTAGSIAGFSGAATGRGWYQDAANSSQKVNSDVYADLNIVAFAFSEPSSDPCLSALTSTLYVRELTTGNSELLSGGSIVASVNIGGGIAGVALIQSDPTTSSATASAVVQVTSMDGAVRSFNVNLPPPFSNRHRFSWQLVSE